MIQNALDVSVVICTYDDARWKDLAEAVKSVQQQEPPPLEVIVVVDHNSGLLERARTCLEGVITIENGEMPGVSGARNSSLAVAKGSKIVFLDDDVMAEPDWLAHLSRLCDGDHVLGAGGKTIPLWLNGQPLWFPEEFWWVVGCTYRGMPETIGPIRNLFSGNLCVQREVIKSINGFRSGFGKVGTHPEPEDTEICIRALQRWPDRVWIYEPHAIVRHKIPAGRSTWAYFAARCYHEGRGKAALVRHVGAEDGLASERTYTLRTLPQGIVRGIRDAFLRADLAGLARSSAIIAGLAITMAGFVIGTIRQGPSRRQWLKADRGVDRKEGVA